MRREQVQNRLVETTAGMPIEDRGKIEKLAWELFHFAQDAAEGRDESTAAKRALEESMGDLRQQLTNYKLQVERLQVEQLEKERLAVTLEKAKHDREVILQQQLADCKQQLADYKLLVERLEDSLDKTKRDKQIMRDKLDEWNRALFRSGKVNGGLEPADLAKLNELFQQPGTVKK
jgi:hypothetical protein